MVAQAGPVIPQVQLGVKNSPFAGKTVEVAPVTGIGSSTTDKMGLYLGVRESSLSFHYQTVHVLRGSFLFRAVVEEGRGTPDYVLYADIVRQDISDFTALVEVKYSLFEQSTGQKVWEDDISADYAESPSRASVFLAGARSYQVAALSKACFKNSNLMLLRLSAAQNIRSGNSAQVSP
jgi:hypothetical protein